VARSGVRCMDAAARGVAGIVGADVAVVTGERRAAGGGTNGERVGRGGGGTPWRVPPEPVSLVVQALPSSHGAVFGVWTQPVAGLQESSVQPLPSSQLGAGPEWQRPATQTSFVVQALPSLHDAPSAFTGLEHWPVPGSQTPA